MVYITFEEFHIFTTITGLFLEIKNSSQTVYVATPSFFRLFFLTIFFQSDVRLPKPSRPPERPPQPSRSNTPVITSIPPSAVDWTVKPVEKEKYEKLFESLQPTNGLIPGNKVKFL